MSNSPSTKHIEKSLGIADDISKLAGITTDDEKKKQFEERQRKLKEMQETLDKKKLEKKEDKEFVRDLYKELAEVGMMGVRIAQEEAGLTGDYKNIEAMAAAVNSVTSALNGLKSIDHDDEKIKLEREKMEVKKLTAQSQVPNITTANGGTTNVIMCSTADILKQLKDAEKAQAKQIKDAIPVIEEK